MSRLRNAILDAWKAGASLAEELELTPLPVLARHAWGPTERMDLFADPALSRDAIARFAGPAEAARFMQFCQQARKVYWPTPNCCKPCLQKTR